MSETQGAGNGKPGGIITDASRVREKAPAGSSAQTIIEAQNRYKATGRRVESKKPGKREIFEQAQLLDAFASSFNLLEEDYEKNKLTPEERWTYESIRAAEKKTIDQGKPTFTNDEFKNLETGEEYAQEEGIPVEGLLEFLGKKIENLPADSAQREKLLRSGHILYINSASFPLLPHRMEPQRLLARVRQEAYFVSKDVRGTKGSDFDNWLKAERTLMGRLELVLPIPEVQTTEPAPEKLPKPEEAAEVAPAPKPAEAPAAAAEQLAEAAPAAPPAAKPTTPQAEPQPPVPGPQPETLEQIRREFTLANRTIDIEKRAHELAEQQLREEMRRGSGWNPLNWPRKIGLGLAEDYYLQLYTERARQAMLAANNSYLTMDVVKNAAITATHKIAEEKEAGRAKVENIKTDEKFEGQQIIEVQGELKNAILSEIIRPVIDGQITTEAQVQQKLREFVQSHQNDPQVQAVFGRDTSLYGRLAEYFATDLLEVGNQVKQDLTSHKYAIEQLSEVAKIRIANASWASESQAQFNRWSDRAVRWAQQGRIRGAILNPATVGALASVTTFLTLRAPGGVARTIAPFAAPGVGVLAGAAFAAARRNYALKVDRAAHQVKRTYNLQIPQGAPRREALERFTYNTASVNELINGGGQELLTGTTRKSLAELLSAALSDGQVTNRANVIRRIAEIRTRLNFSWREKVDLVTFTAREQVEQGRLALSKAVVEAYQALRTTGMSDAEIQQLETNFTGEWSSRFTQNREQQDNAFRNYRLRNAAGAAVFGGVAGLAGGVVSQEGFAQIARHFPEAANIPVIGGLFQKGETAIEKGIRQGQEFLRGGPAAPPAPGAGTLVETTRVLLDPKTSVEANDVIGHRTFIPKGTEWVRDPLDSSKWDLRISGRPDKILINDARFDSSGKLVDWNHTTSQDSLFKLDNTPQGEEAIKGAQAVSEWDKLKTSIHHREWYAYDQPGAQGNELKLYTAKDGDAVTLDMSKMKEGFQKGLTPNPIDVQEAIKNRQSGFMFSIPGPDGKLISAWVPDGADGLWDGKLRLDPNSAREISVGGKIMTLGEFSKMVLNQGALKPLPNSDIATELYNRQDVFKLGVGGKNGFIEAGTLVDRPEGKVLQAFATIRGNGTVQVEVPKGVVAEVSLKGPWEEVIKEEVIKKVVPVPEVLPLLEGEAPPVIPIPFARRHPLEPLERRGETPQGEAPPASAPREPEKGRKPEKEERGEAEQVIAEPAVSDQLAATREELAGLEQGLAVARRSGIEPDLKQKARLEQLRAEVKRPQQEAAAPAPASGPQPPPPPPSPAPAAGPTDQPTGPPQPTEGEAPPPAETLETTAQAARGEAEEEKLRTRIIEEKNSFDQLDGELGLFISNLYTTVPHMLWQEVIYGPPRTKNGDNCFRGYLMIEPKDMGTALLILRHWGKERRIVGKRTDFKWLVAANKELSKKEANSLIGTYPDLQPADARIVIYGDTPDEIQEILARLTTEPIWQQIEQHRAEKFEGLENTPRRPGTNSFIDGAGNEWRSLNYNDKPGYSEDEAKDPDWRSKKAGTKTVYNPPASAEPAAPPPPAAAEPAVSDQLTAAKDELAGLKQGLAVARRSGIEPDLKQKARLEQLRAEVKRPQQEAAAPAPASGPQPPPPPPSPAPAAGPAGQPTEPPQPTEEEAPPPAETLEAAVPGLDDIGKEPERLQERREFGKPLSEEAKEKLQTWIRALPTEEDLVKRLSIAQIASSLLQADSSRSLRPLRLEEAKDLIVDEFLAFAETNRSDFIKLLEENKNIREALEIVRDREFTGLGGLTLMKALQAQRKAQEILQILEQKQPPEFLSTRPQPSAQTPTGPLLTEKERQALENARKEIRTMGTPPPAAEEPLTPEEIETILAAVPEESEPEAPAEPAVSDQLTAARDELAGLEQGLAAARRFGIEPNLEQKARLEQLRAEVKRPQQETAARKPILSQEEIDALLGPEPEAPALPDYVEEAGEKLDLTREEKEALAERLKTHYFEDEKFKEEATLVTQDRLEEILRQVLSSWHELSLIPEKGEDEDLLESGTSRRELKNIQKRVTNITPKLLWQLLYICERDKSISQYSDGEIRAFLRAIDIMGRTQSQKDNATR